MTKLIEEDVFEYLNFNPEIEQGATFAVPNELITDFKDTQKIGKCAYAYSYYYLTMYLHMFAKYGIDTNIDKFTFGNIQKLLGISSDSRTMNPFTKKGGLLDELGYTSTVTDYPVNLMRMESIDGAMEINHYMYSEEKRDFPDLIKHSKNFTVKHPDKMYWRDSESKTEHYYNGTMNEPDNTHMIPLEMFLHAINLPNIMTKGFYVYGYIVYMSDKTFNQDGWTVSLEYFCKFLGVSENTLKIILKALEHHNFIKVKRKKKTNNIDLPNMYVPNLNPKRVVYDF